MRVLIGGEFTGTIRDAFIARGHYAKSCDFSASLTPGPHHQGNWWDIMWDGWDLAIFHPTCTNMANSGALRLFIKGQKKQGLDVDRWTKLGLDAWAVWDLSQRCPIPFFAIENPIMLSYAKTMSGLDKAPMQTVQPWWFGTDEAGPDNESKATCWWTFGGLPKLQRTGTLDGTTARESVLMHAPTADPELRRMNRSRFHPGHAAAIADQWGSYVERALSASASAWS